MARYRWCVDLALTSTGDLSFVNGELQLVEGTEAVAQHLRIRLRWFVGEWYLDRRLGMPWFAHALVKRPNAVLLKSLFREAALTTPGVLEVRQLSLSIADRKLTVTMQLRIDGEGAPVPFTFAESPLEVAA